MSANIDLSEVRQMATDELTLDEENARLHGTVNLKAIKESLDRFGQQKPIVVSPDGVVYAGNGTLMAARELGWESVSVSVSKLPKEELRAYALADNRTAELAEWDDQVLSQCLKSLNEQEDGQGLVGTGFSLTDLKVFNGVFEEQPTPEPSEEPVAKIGDLWALGDHRLACGDSTDSNVVARAMDGHLADLVFTDPPYGVSYESPSGEFDAIQGDNLQRDGLVMLLQGALGTAARYSKDEAAFYVWHANATRDDFSFAMKSVGLEERQYLVWAKPSIVLGHADYHWSHEPCFYSCKAGHSPEWYGDRTQQTVWRIEAGTSDNRSVVLGPGLIVSDGQGNEITLLSKTPKKKLRSLRTAIGETIRVYGEADDGSLWEVARDPGKPVHPTQKPSALAARALRNSTPEGGRVLDVFAGGGAVVIAADQMGRTAHMVELSPQYVDVIVQRWENMTGEKAVLMEKQGSKA